MRLTSFRCFHRFTLGALLLLLPATNVSVAQSPPGIAPPSAAPLDAAQRKNRLDGLFAALKAAKDDDEANEFVAEIWRVWSNSGRPDIDALMARALGAMNSRDYGLASMLLDSVVDEAPDFAEGWNRRATLRFMMGDHAGSTADIDKVLALEPRHFGAIAGQAMIHMTAERWKEALASYRQALAVNPYLRERQQLIPMLEKKVEGEKL